MAAEPWTLDDDLDDQALWWAALAAEPPSGAPTGILERAAAARPRWQARAACAGLGPGRFYPEKGSDGAAAKAVCARCPVVGPCGRLAADNSERFGIWAGVNTADRGRTPTAQ